MDETVYKGLTAPQLETAYNARKAVPEHMDYFDRWADRSAELRATARTALNLPYGDGAREKIDLFLTDKPGAPLIVFIHGGYWQALDRSIFSFVAAGFLAAGVNVALPGYSLCPDTTLDDIARQIHKAGVWLAKAGPTYDIDTTSMIVTGHSAGGHLTAMMMSAAPNNHADQPSHNPLFNAGLAISGLYDLEPLRHTSINEKVAMDRAMARRNSPIYRVPASGTMVVTWGTGESAEFERQARDLASAWRGHGTDVTELPLNGLNHFDVVEQLADANSPVFKATIGLLNI